jgi:rhodanese-related sulfurtransferase
MGDLAARANEIPRDTDVVLYCEKGIRSVIAIQRLEAAGYTNLANLTGGMSAWRAADK